MTDSESQSDEEHRDTSIGEHPDVLAVPGSPPWWHCQCCDASRSTHAGLRDLPCKPGRYKDISPGEHVSAGDVVLARVDQTLSDDKETVVLAHAVSHGVRLQTETREADIARGDLVEIRIEALDSSHGVTTPEVAIKNVRSREERVPSPTLTRIEETGGEDR